MPKPKRHRARRPPSELRSDEVLRLYGLHTVRAALRNPNRRVERLLATPNALERLGDLARDDLTVERVQPADLDRLVGRDAVHQGLVLEARPLPQLDASELFHLADKRLVVVLDQVTDPHNVGAILRSAAAFAADAVIVTSRQSAPETAVLAKSASGALDHVPLIAVRNLSGALGELNEQRYLTLGLDSDGPTDMAFALREHPPERVALVLGAEGKGLREQTREACTVLARLDLPGAIRSLNVSNAAVLALHMAREAVPVQSS